MTRPLHIKNARIWDGEKHDFAIRDLYTANGRVVDQPHHDALVVDLEGYTIFPGLVNAHDHLELNHFPRTKFRDVYDNAHQWGEDVNARLNDEPFKTLRSYPLRDRLFIGGLKNLLCGVTTVVHHGPPHKPMFRKDFPVRVLKNYGWAHSLHFNTEEEIIKSYKNTPKNVSWFIHLAEGTDEVAASEFPKLIELGCIGENTVLVHGVGLLKDDIMQSFQFYGSGHGQQMPIVWCPTTNIYLLGETYHPRMGWNTQLALGSDSRLTADGDLLDEMRWIAKNSRFTNGEDAAVGLATKTIIRWGVWEKDKRISVVHKDRADFVLIRSSENPALSLCESTRKDLSLIAYNNIPQIGDPDLMAKFPHVQTVACTLDGVEKRINIALAKQIHRCKLKEKRLEVDDLPKGRFWLF